MKNIISCTLLCIFLTTVAYSQTEDMQVGSSLLQRYQTQGGFYDYSDPEALNIKVAVWGYVRYPGKYIIPANSNVNDLLSYAGGPSNDTELEYMTVIRTNEDSSQTIIELNYTDFLFDEQMRVINKPIQLQAGDILVAPGEPRLYFTNYLTITLAVITTVTSLAILILNISQ